MGTRYFKLFTLAVCIGGMLVIAWLIYPHAIERVFAELNEEANNATQSDFAIFIEAISLGFAIGFYLLKAFFKKYNNEHKVKEIEADRWELKTVFSFISGFCFFWGSLTFFEQSDRLQGTIHLIIGLAIMLSLPYRHIKGLKKIKAERIRSI